MRLVISKSPTLWGALYIKQTLKRTLDIEKRYQCVLGLPTGGTMEAMYAHLVNFHKQEQLSFENVITFNMDEYVGLTPDHPQSYHHYMHQHLFDHVDIKAEHTHLLDGMAADVRAEARRYEDAIEAAGGIDLFVGGVGESGHIAFNEPYSSLTSRTRDKALDDSTITANARFFDGDESQVPRTCLTVGVGTITDAREVMILVTGSKKASALSAAVEGAVSHTCTLSILQMHPSAIIVCDEEACEELKVGTYRYFKNLQDEFSYIEEDVCKRLGG
jgi:glucosamine-6-phosphate deaminase